MTAEIINLLKEKAIKELDLTRFNFMENPIDFSGKTLESVDFSGNETLKDISFNSSVLIDCKFERSVLDSCDFACAQIKGTGDAKYASFKDSKINKTKFREAVIETCDFRYAEIKDSTFQEALFIYIDFYRTAFKGITIFKDCKIESSSLNYISFETFCFTQDNLQMNKSGAVLVQENEAVYRDFLSKWVRKDISRNTMSIVEDGLAHKYKEAENIYRQLSALWEERGHNEDANWAYIQKKRMERNYLWYEKTENKFKSKLSAFLNLLMDLFLGYGVSMSKVFITYLLTIAVFGVVYKILLGADIGSCLKMSISFTIGTDKASNPAIETLCVIQTGIGMLLTGFMGYVVANKIRRS